MAAVLWHAPASIRVPNGETRTIEARAMAGSSGAGRLVFRVRADYWRPAGSNPLLRVRVNDREVGMMRDRRTARIAAEPERANGLARFDFGRWRVPQGPGGGAELAIDVSDLVVPGGPLRIAFECASAGSLGPTPLVIDDVRLEAGGVGGPAPEPVPDWRTPRLALPAPPAFEVDADRERVRIAWQGERIEVATVVTGAPHERARDVVRFADRAEVRDTFTNTSGERLGLRVRHSLPTATVRTHLGGRLDPDVNDAYSPWNPTIFTPVGSAGIGLVAEDDVFRQQLSVDYDAQGGTVGMRTEMLCLGAGERATLVWSVYPVRTRSYWDFINRVRLEWQVNRRVDGSFIWFTPDAILALPPDALRAALDRQQTAVASLFGGWIDPRRKERPPFIGFGSAVLRDEFADYRRRIEQAIARLKDARPGLKVLLYFDPQRDSSPDAPQRFADSVLRDLHGTPERVDWGGAFSPSWGMVPTGDDAFGGALRAVVAAMGGLGADGLYWDEMDGVDFRLPRVTTSRSDGRTCALDATGRVATELGLVNLLSDAVKAEYADAAGLVLGNVPPTTRRFTARPDLRMVEAEDDEPWGPMAHLTTPLAYVGNRRDFAIVRAKIDEGLLPIGARLDVDHDLVARLFPFTPEHLQPGTLRGRERIVTTESGTHGWRDCAGRVDAYRYDAAGREHRAAFREKRKRGGAYVRVRLAGGEAAVLECARAAHG